ncbi:MAG: glycosyltransferase family 9 protein [Deltaproteobacteria bacterium]|nr:glycosyltransferase family 9 protein [Deltaproteobacteria bacterium]
MRTRWKRVLRVGHKSRIRALAGAQLVRLRRARESRRPYVAVSLIEHMGDILASEPVIRHLREAHPRAHLTWLVRAPYRELLEHHPDLDEVLTVECLTQTTYLRDGFPWDLYVDLHIHRRSCKVCRVPLKKSVGDPRIDVDRYYEFGSLLEAFCLGAGLPQLTGAPRVYIPPASELSVNRLSLPARFAVVHCSSNEPERDWQTDKWVELCSALSREGLGIVEVGVRSTLPPRPDWLDSCGRLSILETAEVIKRSALFVGVDSGPAHLANATRCPSVILLGRYRRFKKYAPYTGFFREPGRNVIIHHDGPPAGIPVQQVLEACKSILGAPLPSGTRLVT